MNRRNADFRSSTSAVDDETRIHARSVTLSSEELGLIAKMDLVEDEGAVVAPVDYNFSPKGAACYSPEQRPGTTMEKQEEPCKGDLPQQTQNCVINA